MKAIFKISLIVAAFNISACSSYVPQQSYDQEGPVSMQVFYNQLSPFGMWVNYPPYGYVWIPDVPFGFSPYYTSGYWVYTRYGWTWYSYYSWGWAPFHYGRWYYDIMYGWIWIPDTIWGPAWVVWRTGGGYCGWAPLGPNISIDIVISGGHRINREHWIYVRDSDLSRKQIDRYGVERSRNGSIEQNTTIMRHVREERSMMYMPGPDKDEIQRVSKRQINQVDVVERNQPGSDRLNDKRLEIFKPQIQKETETVRKSAPDRIYDLKEVKKQSEREEINMPQREPTGKPQQINPPLGTRKQQNVRPPSRERSRPDAINKSNSGKAKPKKKGN